MTILTSQKIPGNTVVPATELLPTMPYAKALSIALSCPCIEAHARDIKDIVSPDQSSYDHAFIAAVNTAYARHYPLVFSPDMIWLLIAQGFACHINQNAETLRHQFVQHQGKVKLSVERLNFIQIFDGDDWEYIISGFWESIFTEFSEQIRNYIGDSVHQVIVPSFSTTGIVEKAAFEITLMDVMQSYFEYQGMICGIPWFVLEGTPEDWQLLRNNAATLTQYDLDWWIPHLLPVLDEFVAASRGTPNPVFWANFCRDQARACGDPNITGFVCNLFPYVKTMGKTENRLQFAAQEELHHRMGVEFDTIMSEVTDPEEIHKQYWALFNRLHTEIPHLRRVPSTSLLRNTGFVSAGQSSEEIYGLSRNDFPPALSVAPFTLCTPIHRYDMEFIAGFVGFAQDRETLAIRPEIGWAVKHKEK